MVAVGEGMREAFERLAPVVPVCLSSLSDDQLVGFAQDVEVFGRHTDALRLAVAREIDNRSDATLGEDSLARRLGARNPAGAIENVTFTSAEDARRRVTEARLLAKLPVVQGAVDAGVLGRAQAEVITAPILPAARVADPVTVAAACTHLVELAQTVPASAVVEAARAWAAILDPDGIEPEETAALEKRFLRLGRARNGLVKLVGALTVEQAATMRAVIDSLCNPRTTVTFTPDGERIDDALTGLDEALAAQGVHPPADTRTLDQKRADALHLVFARAARDAETPTMGGAHPTILVTVTKENLETGTGPAWVDGEDQPVSAATARRIACTGGYQEVQLGTSGEILALGRTERCFTPAQRRALIARDTGCVIPGCTIPARWCETHHIRSWRDGGQTDVNNAALLCWFHHQTIDTGPWQLKSTEGPPQIRWTFGSHTSPWVTAVHSPPRRI